MGREGGDGAGVKRNEVLGWGCAGKGHSKEV